MPLSSHCSYKSSVYFKFKLSAVAIDFWTCYFNGALPTGRPQMLPRFLLIYIHIKLYTPPPPSTHPPTHPLLFHHDHFATLFSSPHSTIIFVSPSPRFSINSTNFPFTNMYISLCIPTSTTSLSFSIASQLHFQYHILATPIIFPFDS